MMPLLRAPPFPGSKPVALTRKGHVSDDPEPILVRLRSAKIGGTFWGRQPDIAPGTVIACPWDAASASAMAQRADASDNPILFWIDDATIGPVAFPTLRGTVDPWHVASHAQAIWGQASDERIFIARIAGCAVEAMDCTILPPCIDEVRDRFLRFAYLNPFTDEPATAIQTIDLLAYWRGLIDANRPIIAAAGMAFWKRETVEPLLWGGGETIRHISTVRALEALPADAAIAVWKAKTPPELLAAIEARAAGNPALLHEVEDGFIRSIGLGADCVPPLSITVDATGVHFDPAQESSLERLLNSTDFSSEELDRAEAIRTLIVSSGLSKYGVGNSETLARPGGARRHVLVTGQVEDDRSVLAARGEVRGNLDLLRRARAAEPDAYILYRPHPDVDAGHRKGHIADDDALAHADAIDRGTPISALLDMVDGVHVLSSLAGFEALLRGRDVTTHGVPFYAGWGLTRDLGATPARRKKRLDVNALAAGVLLLYPRYLDPVTALPCPPEILVQRLIAGIRKESRFIVPLRKLQGKMKRWGFRVGSNEEI